MHASLAYLFVTLHQDVNKESRTENTERKIIVFSLRKENENSPLEVINKDENPPIEVINKDENSQVKVINDFDENPKFIYPSKVQKFKECD